MRPDLRPLDPQRTGPLVRVAAIGDLHVGTDSAGVLRERLAAVADEADLLLLAGDLTQHGTAEEGEVLADELRGIGLPILAVLGNHDYHADAELAMLEDPGIGLHLQLRHTEDVRSVRRQLSERLLERDASLDVVAPDRTWSARRERRDDARGGAA